MRERIKAGGWRLKEIIDGGTWAASWVGEAVVADSPLAGGGVG
jgi:hypothetical protein